MSSARHGATISSALDRERVRREIGPEDRRRRGRGYGDDLPFALALTDVLALLSLFQVALALGAPLGKFAWGGAHRVLPTKLRIGSLVSVALHAVIASLAWFRVGVAPLGESASPGRFVVVAMWLVFANFCAAIVLNALSRSRSERAVMVPTSMVLAALGGVIALG